MITNNVEYEKAELEIRDLQERLERSRRNQTRSVPQVLSLRRLEFAKMIVRQAGRIGVSHEGSEEARESKAP